MDCDDDEAKASRSLLNASLIAIGLGVCAAAIFIGGGLVIPGAIIGGICLLGSVTSAFFPPEDAFERSCRECEQSPVSINAPEPAVNLEQAHEHGQHWQQTVDASRKTGRCR